MKFLSKLFLLAFVMAALQASSTFAQTSDGYNYGNLPLKYWQIDSFHSDIKILPSGKLNITETIVANFTNEAHRGIARTIPYFYDLENAPDRKVTLEYKSAVNENGEPWKVETFMYNNMEVQMTNYEDEYRNDINTFVLNYTASGVFNYFEKHQELYWNVNGTEWPVSTKAVSTTIHLPKNLKKEEVKLQCYTGSFGAKNEDCKEEFNGKNEITFSTTKEFEPYENLTIVIGLPPGTIRVSAKTGLQNFETSILETIIDFSPLLLPFLTLIITLYLWRRHGRDDQTVKDTIMPHYKPPQDLVPTQTGTIIDEKVDPRDITATILDFAVKGYIRINQIEEKGLLFNSKDYELELIKPYKTTHPFEKIIMEAIFSSNTKGEKKKISELKNKFYNHIPEIQESVIKQLIKDDFFPHNPHSIRLIGYIIGFVLAAGGPQIGIAVGGGLLAFSISASGVIVLLMTRTFPRKTKKGTETYYILKGLYEYIETAEKDRMQFQEENNIVFEKLLPYAASFGLIEKWTNAFAEILKVPPTWYYPYGGWHDNIFDMTAFAHDLNNFSSNITENIASTPGKNGSGGSWSGGSGFGGGFSGGGFGGGGGRGL